MDRLPKKYRVNHKQCRQVERVWKLQPNSYAEKRPNWPWPRMVAVHVRGGAMRKDKRMLNTRTTDN